MASTEWCVGAGFQPAQLRYSRGCLSLEARGEGTPVRNFSLGSELHLREPRRVKNPRLQKHTVPDIDLSQRKRAGITPTLLSATSGFRLDAR